MPAYYNEIDPFAAAWLRELIRTGHIADGEVDTRSIADVQPDDVRGFTQCHFFAGIGGWSYALRLAGWADDRIVWTGSCPCQPFSSAGKGHGTADPRHLWPEFRRLIAECRPPVVFGEQVASKAGRTWLAGVFADVEALAYRRAGADLCAASAGAPHIRQRLWWVADTGSVVRERWSSQFRSACAGQAERDEESIDAERGGAAGRLGESKPERLQGFSWRTGILRESAGAHAGEAVGRAGDLAGWLADTNGGQSWDGGLQPRRDDRQRAENSQPGCGGLLRGPAVANAWFAYDLLLCRDGVSRRVEPGTFPLAYGVPARVGRLRGYGNAIVPQVAAAFIEAYCDAVAEVAE